MKSWYGRGLIPIGRNEQKDFLHTMYGMYLSEQADNPGLRKTIVSREREVRAHSTNAGCFIRYHIHNGVTDKQVSQMSTVMRCAEKAQIKPADFTAFVNKNKGFTGVCLLWEKIQ